MTVYTGQIVYSNGKWFGILEGVGVIKTVPLEMVLVEEDDGYEGFLVPQYSYKEGE